MNHEQTQQFKQCIQQIQNRKQIKNQNLPKRRGSAPACCQKLDVNKKYFSKLISQEKLNFNSKYMNYWFPPTETHVKDTMYLQSALNAEYSENDRE